MSKTTRSDAFSLMFGELTDSDIKASKLKHKVAKTIYLKRKELGLTQGEFAKLLGVSQGMVSKWESFDYNFSIEAMAEIFDKLDTEIDIRTGVDALDYINVEKTLPNDDECRSRTIGGWVCHYHGKLAYIENVQADPKEVTAS